MGLGSGILQPSGHCISIHWSWSNLLATFGIIASLRDHTVRARNAEARHGVREKDVPFRAPLLEDATKMSFPRSLSHALDPASVLDASGETNFLPRPLQSAPPPPARRRPSQHRCRRGALPALDIFPPPPSPPASERWSRGPPRCGGCRAGAVRQRVTRAEAKAGRREADGLSGISERGSAVDESCAAVAKANFACGRGSCGDLH